MTIARQVRNELRIFFNVYADMAILIYFYGKTIIAITHIHVET